MDDVELISNMSFLIDHNSDGIDLAADGTHKLIDDNWILLITIDTRFLKRKSDNKKDYHGKEDRIIQGMKGGEVI